MQNAWRATSSDPDKPVARLEVWLARLAVLAAGAALLATSPAPQYSYTFSKSVAGPPVELTAAAPRARFLVTARALGLAPNDSPTTTDGDVLLEGSLTQSGAAKFVVARITSDADPTGSELTALTSFRLARALTFRGDCETPDRGAPCETSFFVELERADGGETGGSVAVNWSLELQARARKDEGPDQGPLELPWSVELSEP